MTVSAALQIFAKGAVIVMMNRGFVSGMITGGLLGMAVGMMMLPEARGGATRRMASGSRELRQRAQRLIGRTQMKARTLMPDTDE